MSVVDRLGRGIKATLGANLLNTLARAGLILALTRVLLEPDEYGQLNLALSVVGVVAILATLGIPKSAARYVTELGERDPGQVPHVIRRSTLFIGVTTLVVSVGVIVTSRLFASALGIRSLVPFLTLGGAYIAARSFSKYFSALFQGYNRVAWTAVLTTVTGVGQFLAAVTLVYLGHGAFGAFAGYVVGYVASAAVGAVVLYTRFYEPPTEPITSGLSRRIAEYSVPLTATRGANVLDKKVDTVLIGVLVNVTAVGYYTVAKQVSDFVAMPASAFGYTLSPALGKQKSEDRADSAARLYERSLEYVLLAYVPAVVGLVLVADPMVRYVFGADYLGAVPVVQVFSGFVLVNAVNKITSDALDYLGRARSRAIVKSATAVANFLLNLLLIPRFGAVGAAAATVVTYTVYTLSNVVVIHSELSLSVWRVVRRLGAICLIAVGMGVIVAVGIPHVSGLPSLLGVVAAGVVVWAGLSVVGGLLDPAEVAEFLG